MSALPPTTFDTTNLDTQQAIQMEQIVAQYVQNGQPMNVIGPNASAVMNGADAINNAHTATPSNSTMSNMEAIGATALAGAAAVMLPSMASANLSIAKKNVQALSGPFSWLNPTTWGNFGLILFGAALGLGALLISQKETIIKVGDTAAKGAALLG